jgi:hypothetical protein
MFKYFGLALVLLVGMMFVPQVSSADNTLLAFGNNPGKHPCNGRPCPDEVSSAPSSKDSKVSIAEDLAMGGGYCGGEPCPGYPWKGEAKRADELAMVPSPPVQDIIAQNQWQLPAELAQAADGAEVASWEQTWDCFWWPFKGCKGHPGWF